MCPRVIIAPYSGFCSGVKAAIAKVDQLLRLGKTVWLEGELVHNKSVCDAFYRRGVRILSEDLRDDCCSSHYQKSEILECQCQCDVETKNAREVCALDYCISPTIFKVHTDITQLGFPFSSDLEKQFSKNAVIVIRAHGITRARREQLMQYGCPIVDATCPWVRKIAKAIEIRHDRPIILLGDRDHAEVKGLISYGRHIAVCRNLEELDKVLSEIMVSKKTVLMNKNVHGPLDANLEISKAVGEQDINVASIDRNLHQLTKLPKHAENSELLVPDCPKESSVGASKMVPPLTLLSQSTLDVKFFNEAVRLCCQRCPDSEILDTICPATKQRQQGIRALDHCDAVVVIGGKNSANTRRLYEQICIQVPVGGLNP